MVTIPSNGTVVAVDGKLRIGRKVIVGFVTIPTVVAPFFHDVDFFDQVLPNIGGPKFSATTEIPPVSRATA